MVQESQQNKKCSAADLYVVPYGRYNLMESMPLSMMKHLEDDVPPVFMILDTFDKDIKVTLTLNFKKSFIFNLLFIYFNIHFIYLFMFSLVSVLISSFSVIGEYNYLHFLLSAIGKGTWQTYRCVCVMINFIVSYFSFMILAHSNILCTFAFAHLFKF